MNVAWDSCWGGSRSTKPCVFPCKLAAAGHEGQLLCEAGAAWIVSTRNRFFHGVLQRLDANRIVVAAWMCAWCCTTQCYGYMNVAWDPWIICILSLLISELVEKPLSCWKNIFGKSSYKVLVHLRWLILVNPNCHRLLQVVVKPQRLGDTLWEGAPKILWHDDQLTSTLGCTKGISESIG